MHGLISIFLISKFYSSDLPRYLPPSQYNTQFENPRQLMHPNSEYQIYDMSRYGRSGSNNMIPMARIGKQDGSAEDNKYKSVPMPRFGWLYLWVKKF